MGKRNPAFTVVRNISQEQGQNYCTDCFWASSSPAGMQHKSIILLGWRFWHRLDSLIDMAKSCRPFEKPDEHSEVKAEPELDVHVVRACTKARGVQRD